MPRSHFISRFALLLVVLLSALPSTRANDTLVTLGAGGLVPLKSSNVLMESERLHITLHRVTVDYVFRNTTNQDIDAIVAFPLPELDGATLEISPVELPSKDPTNFVSFKLTVDGKSVSPKTEIRAFKKDQEITEQLKSLGLPISVLDTRLKGALAKLSKIQLSQLEQDDWIVKEEFETGGKASPRYWPWWQTHIQFYWTQHFRANSSIRISHTYVPVVGGSYIDDDGSHTAQRYCGTASTLQQIQDRKAKVDQQQQPGLTLWAGPIKHFHLEIDSDAPDDILMTCMPNIQQTSPTRYELDALDFHPDRNLNLVILQPHQNQSPQIGAQ